MLLDARQIPTERPSGNATSLGARVLCNRFVAQTCTVSALVCVLSTYPTFRKFALLQMSRMGSSAVVSAMALMLCGPAAQAQHGYGDDIDMGVYGGATHSIVRHALWCMLPIPQQHVYCPAVQAACHGDYVLQKDLLPPLHRPPPPSLVML